ncbi:hypothetical protein B0H13DRAFT_1871414 [Mycena leptocephala]|nr:hypothetical protein B0H13DRAFT_1871414 [Mycena leptocephala]
MSPINHPLIACNVDASSPTNAVLAATSSPSPIAHGGQPNIPIWVGYIAGVLLLCAIVAVCYFAYKASRKWRAKVPELITKSTAPINTPSKAKSAAPASSTETLIGATIAPPPPAYTAWADNAIPESEYARLHITRTNTLKNQRRGVQVFAKPSVVETPLPPILRPDGARW